MNDYGEPWSAQYEITGESAWDPNGSAGFVVLDSKGRFLIDADRDDEEMIERIVACVNACRSIPTSKLDFIMDSLFTAMMSAEAIARLGSEPTRDDLMIVYSDCLNAARAMKHAGVDLTDLLEQCRLETPNG